MILLIHQRAEIVLKVLKNDEEINLGENRLSELFWKLAEKYPEELIVWCEDRFQDAINLKAFSEIFDHALVMASYAIKTGYFSNRLGYIDQLPFIKVNRKVKFPTWQMSCDVGGIKGETLKKFKDIFRKENNFQMLINSIGKLGQQNGLFCYSEPNLVTIEMEETLDSTSMSQLFGFVYSHYKSIRLLLLFWCIFHYERSFPLLGFLKAVFRKKYFQRTIDLSVMLLNSKSSVRTHFSIDVVIPTLGRKKHLLQVLNDLEKQTLLPMNVIIVEQNPESGSKTDLDELKKRVWPFNIIHHFVHEVGACNARNLALQSVEAKWVFFADDDIRLEGTLLEKSLNELARLNVSCLNLNCKQEGETTVFKNIKQWGSFGSGTSIVRSEFCKTTKFDRSFEYGFGEDQDYGMQLRNKGCDIIYHPELEILHLKAPSGGFRARRILPWKDDEVKPSPTLMAFVQKHYTEEEMKGFKTELFLRFYSRQKIKNPWRYIYSMKVRWRKSEYWASKIKKSSFENESVAL